MSEPTPRVSSVPVPPTYETLFGDDDYYSIDPSRSVLSPAAYLADLLLQVDQYIIPGNTAVPLDTRQPDLKNYLLDGANTLTPVSKIGIVNSVLTTVLKGAGSIAALRTTNYPFSLPYSQPFEQIRIYLKQHQTSRSAIQQTLFPQLGINPGSATSLDIIGVTNEQWAMYRVAATPAALNSYYGLASNADTVAKLKVVDTFLSQTGLSLDSLQSLLYEDLTHELVRENAANGFYINVGGDCEIFLSPDFKTLNNLSLERLDHINRFVRLSQVIGWSYTDLDWALQTIYPIAIPTATAPSIQDAILPYLAWIHEWNITYGLSINQCCALIGTIKQTGGQNGVSFFESIFQNPSIPGSSILVPGTSWNIPTQTTMPAEIDQQIQNVLSAALQVSQDDLIAISNLVAKNAGTLELTIANLSVLYRFGLLPSITGFPVRDLIEITDILGIKSILAGTKGTTVMPGLVTLVGFCKWLAGSSLSVYQLQFILSGKSDDPSVQNNVIGQDAITNFTNGLNNSLAKIVLTENALFQSIKPWIQQNLSAIIGYLFEAKLLTDPAAISSLQYMRTNSYAYAEQINTAIYQASVTAGYIDNNGVVTSAGACPEATAQIPDLLIASFADVISLTIPNADWLADLKITIATFFDLGTQLENNPILTAWQQFYTLQEKACTDNLATLYNVPGNIATVLKKWADINLDKLLEAEQNSRCFVNTIYQLDNDRLSILLCKVQQGAALITNLQLSAQEAAFFKNEYVITNDYPISLDTVKTVRQFKELVRDFRDTQNNLIGILQLTNDIPGNISIANAALVKLTGWQLYQIEYLYTSNNPVIPINVGQFCYSIQQVAMMQQAVFFSNTLAINLPTLWQLITVPATDETAIANALWSGLSTQNDPGKLTAIQGLLDEALRDRLVALAIVTLPHISNSRQLYEYLLIDVEVSSQLQTSVIRNAIAAVQLYVYRCLNHLEPDVKVDPALIAQWSWMRTYTAWEANREVFLYPENYILPTLRPGMTDLFTNLESDLKQADLSNEECIEGAFQNYMNGFEEEAQLQITGSSSHDMTSDNIITREVCFVGRSRSTDGVYFYRCALFQRSLDTDAYDILSWGQWRKINVQLQPVSYPVIQTTQPATGNVTPVFAFGRWYICWVEQTQTGTREDSGPPATRIPLYTATIRYSHLDFNKNWVAAKTLATIDLHEAKITTQADSAVYPVYFNSVETIYITYGKELFTLSENELISHVVASLRFGSPDPVSQNDALTNNAVHPLYQYNYNSSSNQLTARINGDYTFSTWFKLADDTAVQFTDLVSIQAGVGIFIKGSSTPVVALPDMLVNTWHYIAIINTVATCIICIDGATHSFTVQGLPTLIGTAYHGCYYLDATGSWQPAPLSAIGQSVNMIAYAGGYVYTSFAGGSTNPMLLGFLGATGTLLGAEAGAGAYVAAFENSLCFCYQMVTNNSPFWIYTPPDKFVKTLPIPNTSEVFCIKVIAGTLYIGAMGGLFSLSSTSGTIEPVSSLSANYIGAIELFRGTIYALADNHCYTCPVGSTTWTPMPNIPQGLMYLQEVNNELYLTAGVHQAALYRLDLKTNEWILETWPRDAQLSSLFAIAGYTYIASYNVYRRASINEPWTVVESFPNVTPGCISQYDIPVPQFSGATQEMLFFNTALTTDQIINLYEKSTGNITYDFEKGIETASAFTSPIAGNPPAIIPVIMQPNWSIATRFKVAFLLSSFTTGTTVQLTPYRLDSSAVNMLGTLLHRSEGIDALLSIAAQRTREIDFASLFPVASIFSTTNLPLSQIDFSDNSAMSNYYWELFFHAPMLVAKQLYTNQQFESAQTWLQYIFNPRITQQDWNIDNDPNINDKYWRFLGLRESHNPELKKELGSNTAYEIMSDLNELKELTAYRTDPYDPQKIALLRPVAYQKTILMQYIDNLIDRGDMLYRQNTRETIAEAEMFYVEAYDLLGPQPDDLGPAPTSLSLSFVEIDHTYFQGSVWTKESNYKRTDTINCIYHDNGRIYLGTSTSLHVSEDMGLTFTDLTKGSLLAGINIYSIITYNKDIYVIADPPLPQTAWVYQFSAAANTWQRIEIHGATPIFIVVATGNGTIYLGSTGGLFISVDAGVSFLISSDATLAAASITAIVTDTDTVYVTTSSNGIFVSTDQGATWTQPAVLPTAGLGTIAAKDNTAILPTTTGLFVLVAGNWFKANVNVPPNPLQTVVLITDEGLFYVAVQNNVWTSVDMGATWTSFQFSASTFISSLQENDGTIYAVSSGSLMISRQNGDWKQAGIPWIYLSNIAFFLATPGTNYIVTSDSSAQHTLWPTVPYFEIPRNDQFLNYWDTLTQRISYIRQGLTIDGQPDTIPLFDPAINPLSMMQAVASGAGIGQDGSFQNTIIPYYRFAEMVARAKEVTETVIQLGQSLLSALEKKDAERLAILFNNNQQDILQLTQASKLDQLNAATQNITVLQTSLQSALDRQQHYTGLINAGLSSYERTQVNLQTDAVSIQTAVEGIKIAAIIGYSLPDIYGLADGGMKFGDAINQGAHIAEGLGNLLNIQANLAGTIGSYQRRGEDWQLQATLAQDDINQVNQQIIAAQYQQSIAQEEIILLQKTIDQANKISNFYLQKFTTEQLYQWYIGKISGLYFQAYQLAQGIAIQAENAWKFEQIGRVNQQASNFIQPGYWSSLYDGLLAGEALRLDLQRMEKAFTDQHERRLEIQKTISLAQLDSKAVYDLRTTGSCIFDFIELDFDFDYPGHYCRQIKTIAVSLPMVIGPYQNIHATLTQLSSKIVMSDDDAGCQAVSALYGSGSLNSPSLKIDVRPNQQIALSQGVNDAGLFGLNFEDQRYLPFEGTGAVSSWLLEIPFSENNIDFDSITDVIIQLKYTALAGKNSFRNFVQTKRGDFSGSHIIYLSQLPGWQTFEQQTGNSYTVNFILNPLRLRANTSAITIQRLQLFTDDQQYSNPLILTINSTPYTFTFDTGIAKLTLGSPISINHPKTDRLPVVLSSVVPPGRIKNLFLIISFTAKK